MSYCVVLLCKVRVTNVQLFTFRYLKSKGVSGKVIDMNAPGKRGCIWSDKEEARISENGRHKAVLTHGAV